MPLRRQYRYDLLPFFISVLCVFGSSALTAQAAVDIYGISKKRDFLQVSSAAPTSQAIIGDPNGPYHFSADLIGSNLNLISPAPRITLPNSTQYTLSGSSTLMGIGTNYVTKSSLDAAFPNGAYSFTAGTSTLPVSLGGSDAYPADTPQITSGTWDGQGRLLINASTGATLTFNDFSQYSSGVGGIISFTIYSMSGTALGSFLAGTEKIALTGYASDSPLTSYSIPAGFLQADRTYYAELSFARIVDLDISNDPIVGSATFMHATGLIISTTTPPVAPLITTQPASQSVTVGANVVLTVTASGSPVPVYQWRKDGVNIAGATLASFTLNNIQLVDAGTYTVVASNSSGIATSEAATLTVNPVAVAPTITLQPASQTVSTGNPVIFTTSATGSPTPTLQWQKGGINISGATSSSLTILGAQLSDAGSYTVVATNSVNSATSNSAVLVVNSAPVFTTQPSSQTVPLGNSVVLTATASGTPSPTYQWQKNGVNIVGATATSYSITSAVVADAGAYTVIATNSVSAVASATAMLAVDATIVAPNNATISFSIE